MGSPFFSQTRIDYSTSNADKLNEFISRRYAQMEIAPLSKQQNIELSGTNGTFQGVKINRSTFKFGAYTTWNTGFNGISFMLPITGYLDVSEERRRASVAQGSAIASDGARHRTVFCGPDHSHFGVTVDRTLFAQRLAVLLARPFAADIAFDFILDSRTGPYPAVRTFLECLNSWEFGEAIGQSPRTAERMPATIADFLLENWSHSYSHHFRLEPPSIAPQHVKLAIDYIEDRPETALSAEELAKLCGVSLRALQYGFRRFVGESITEYGRHIRLRRAKSDLMRTTDSIDIVAARWGFSNAGRFSRHFKAVYGVFPSEVRRSGK